MSEGWAMTQSTARLEVNHDGSEERLHINYTLHQHEPIRKDVLIRRVLSLIAAEEKRLESLTDGQVIAERDELKKRQDIQFVTFSTLD